MLFYIEKMKILNDRIMTKQCDWITKDLLLLKKKKEKRIENEGRFL